MVASVQRLQFVHSATSMIMFHFFIVLLSTHRRPVGWAKSLAVPSPRGHGAPAILPTRKCRAARLCPPYGALLFRRHQVRFLQRAPDLLVLLHLREGRRHVLGAAIPQLDLHQRV